ncbi:hypothetical protein BKA69DRAFT_364101 [Paraphysoderma sedebokerense]|nr:hypothetical protein BKA69DRAFT_364101 [Paraphysoderma sedebokerense]
MSKKDKPSPSRPSPSPPASHPPLLHDAEWSTFVCCILPHLPEPAPSAQLANTSLYLNHLFETIASGLRQKFVLLSQTDVVDWAVDHSKVYDACKEAKQFVDTNPRGTPLPDHILAKITKCKLLSLRQEGIEAKKTPPKPPETIEGSQFNLDSNLKKEAIAAKDAAKDKAKEKDTKEERVRSAKKSQPKVNTNETDSTPEGDTTSRRKTKLRDRVLPKAKVTPIDDEPKDGPDVYYILRDFPSAGFYRYLVDEAEIPIDSIIGLANIATQPSSDSSAPNGTPLVTATSTETSTPQPIPTKTNAEPNPNDFAENQFESINTVESQFRIFKDGTPLGAIERHSDLASDSSLWKKVAFTKIDVLDLTDPVQLFDRIAKTIYQIMKRTELYQKYYNACQVISIPELPDSFFVDLSNAAPSAQNEASTLAQNMTSSYPTYNSILDTLSQYHHGSVEATLGAAIEQVLSSEAPNECIFQPSDDVAVQVNELENYIDQAINGLIGSAGEQQTVAESEKDKEKDAEKDKRQPRLMKQTRLYQLDRLSLVYPSSPPMASVLPPSSSASHNSTPITPLSFAHSIQSHSRASLLQSYLSTSRRKLCDKTLEIIDNENFLRYCELLKMVDKVEKVGVEEFEFGSLSLEFEKMLTEAWGERKDNEKAEKMKHEVTDRYWIERLDKASLLEQIEQAIFTYPIHETRMKAKDNRLYFSVIPPTLEPNGQIAKESTIEVKLKPTFSLFHKLLDSDTETFLNKSVIDFSLNSISLANEKTIDYFYEFSSPPSSSPEHNNGKVTTDIGSKMFLRTLSKDGKEGKEEKETKERNEKVEEKSEVWKRFKESVKVWCTRDGGQIVEKVWTRGKNAETQVISKTLSILHHNCSIHYHFLTHDLKNPASVSAVLNDGSIIYFSYPITNGYHTLQSTSATDGALSGGEGKGCEEDEIPTMSVSLSDGRVVEFDADGLVVRSMKCGVAGECENADKESKVVEVFRKLFWSDSSIHIYYSNQTYRILQPDGTIFERKLLPRVPTRTTSSHARSQNQVHSSRPTTSHSTSHPSDQFTIEWTKTTANGARVRSHGPAQSSNLMWEVVPSLRIATSQDPITGVVTKTREDNVTTVVHPELKNNGGKTIVQFEDETVIESCWTPQCETEYGEEQVQGLSKRVTMRIHDKDNSWNVCFEKGKMETVKVVLGRDIIVSPYLQKSVKQVDQARLVQSSVETNTSVSESIKTRQIGWSVLQVWIKI